MQGFNMGRYVPPDLEGTVSGNALHAKLPPGRSAAKPGVQTVRFEMPFAICAAPAPTTQPRSGPSACATLPARHPSRWPPTPGTRPYVVVAGAAKRDTGPAARDGDLVVMTDEERGPPCAPAPLRASRRRSRTARPVAAATDRIDDLEDVARRQWQDPYARNRALRRTFRVGRRERERQAGVDDGVRARIGFDLDLLPATEADATRAALVEFGHHNDDDAGQRAAGHWRSLLVVKARGDGEKEKNKSTTGPPPAARRRRRRRQRASCSLPSEEQASCQSLSATRAWPPIPSWWRPKCRVHQPRSKA
ncbi:conserved hypothetical protein [Verticillium alfalfae VaMs.102]|uniref:Uncharacterized protein n=1 Tax=Verticillium alfalfae (strain VaMs.102 / ATCC MYA-4576 / FGSC 10136) TaxID=526221 RepID=C9STD7_VERA1|nr:conserved hypothetical protein [Verticillium alfalfae VaMs.102]EEY22052.1 conserved hypothetical protein [Verticillium alfalfae VaMs.102]